VGAVVDRRLSVKGGEPAGVEEEQQTLGSEEERQGRKVEIRRLTESENQQRCCEAADAADPIDAMGPTEIDPENTYKEKARPFG
jgi:hypothetical protein